MKHCIVIILFLCLLITSEISFCQISIINAFPNLHFNRPVFLTHSGDGSNRIFVVEQSGKIVVFEIDPNVESAEIFLDIRDRVNDSANEMGLLGLAFHPDFTQNGFLYVNYTTGNFTQRRTVIARYSVRPDNPNQADPNSEFIILEVGQPFTNHNGGMIQFGSDGYLYIGMGDGGSGGDPFNNGQNRATLLGAILRIDVDNPTDGRNYGIPVDNPFAGNNQGFREEIWAYGLRNPWRFSFDFETNQLWAADVGQDSWEEVDLIEKGQNYGWRIMEGFHCFNPQNCSSAGLTLPIVEYGHNLGCSITGGYIYRGTQATELTGAYIYGDFCSGRIWLLRYGNGAVLADSLLIDTNLNISSFGIDENNELYIVDLNGSIYRFQGIASDVSNENPEAPPAYFSLEQNFPNPFNPVTTITYHVPRKAPVKLIIFNRLGQKIKTLVEGEHSAGSFKVIWDGTNDQGVKVSSGVYFYKLQSTDFQTVRKMVFIQ